MEFDLSKYPQYLAFAIGLKVAVMENDISREETYRILRKYPVLNRLGC